MTPKLSIIIPTYNRKEILLKTLDGYQQQAAREEILEILVVDDGSTDGTEAAVAAYCATSPIAIRYLANPKKGAAAARNHGIREAKGTLLLFGDDDIIPAPALVAEHASWHRRYPTDDFAIVGHVKWSPELHPTPFMEWMALYKITGYAFLTPGQEVSFSFFYSGNISLKRDFLVREGMFDESFQGYGLEDTELGVRLINKGLHVIYNADAIGYHFKRFSYADACRRQEMVCAARELFNKTEAGRYVKYQAPHAKREALIHRLRMAAARVVAPFLAPFTPILDTHIRLPRAVYYLLYSRVAAKGEADYKRKLRRETAKVAWML